jgi:hypothetical protein
MIITDYQLMKVKGITAKRGYTIYKKNYIIQISYFVTELHGRLSLWIPDDDRIIYLSVTQYAQFLWRYPQVKE